jgi:Ca-activated chloride channel family protein
MRRRGPLAGACALLAAAAPALRAQVAPPAAPPAESAPAERAPLAERLAWNARERTAAGIAALEAGDAPQARAALESAYRLRPDDPTAAYNAGSGRLAASDPSAAPLLERAAHAAPPDLQPAAFYNLGGARFAARDFRGAAAAFVETLKRRPDHAAAKHNLELALRELAREEERQRQQQRQQQQQQGQQRRPEQRPNGQTEEDRREEGDERRPDEHGQREQEKSGEQGNQADRTPAPEPRPGGSGQERKPSALPQFRDLPDMTAEQAAALLRAVENLERQQRRERAAKAAKSASAAVEIDW